MSKLNISIEVFIHAALLWIGFFYSQTLLLLGLFWAWVVIVVQAICFLLPDDKLKKLPAFKKSGVSKIGFLIILVYIGSVFYIAAHTGMIFLMVLFPLSIFLLSMRIKWLKST